jgi:hypothetical protein
VAFRGYFYFGGQNLLNIMRTFLLLWDFPFLLGCQVRKTNKLIAVVFYMENFLIAVERHKKLIVFPRIENLHGNVSVKKISCSFHLLLSDFQEFFILEYSRIFY